MANTKTDQALERAWAEYTLRTNTSIKATISLDLFRAGFCAGALHAHESPPPSDVGGDAAEMIRDLQERNVWLKRRVDELEQIPYRICECNSCAREGLRVMIMAGDPCPTCEFRELVRKLEVSFTYKYKDSWFWRMGNKGLGGFISRGAALEHARSLLPEADVGCPACGAVGIPCPPHCPEAKRAAGQ